MTTSEWIAGNPACRLSKRNIYMLMKLALLGRVRYRALPGEPIKFHREDLERLGDDAESPAVQD